MPPQSFTQPPIGSLEHIRIPRNLEKHASISRTRQQAAEFTQPLHPHMRADTYSHLFLVRGTEIASIKLMGDTMIACAIYRHGNRLSRDTQLSMLYVAADYRERGLGEFLLSHVIASAQEKGKDSVSLFSIPQAEEFYRKKGFERQIIHRSLTVSATWVLPLKTMRPSADETF